MRRDIGCKPDGYTRRAVHQKVGEPPGEYVRFEDSIVEVPRPFNGVFVDVAQQLQSERSEPRLGITHSRRAVAVHRPEVAVPVNERRAHVKRLRHAHHCLINGRIAVRVEFTQAVADDTRALAVRFIGRNAELMHCVKYAPLNGFKSVLDARQGSVEYDRFRIRNHGVAHYVLHGLHYQLAYRLIVILFVSLRHNSPRISLICRRFAD